MEKKRKGLTMNGMRRIGMFSVIMCFWGTLFPEKELQEKFLLHLKSIVFFSSCDRGPHNDCIFSFIKKMLQNDIFLLEDEQVIQLGLFQEACEKEWPKKAMNFVKKEEREKCFLHFENALYYIHDYMQNYKKTMQKKGVFFPSWDEPFKAITSDLMVMEKFYIKEHKDRMISEFFVDLYAMFDFFYNYPRGSL
jgi:hypothetical protein